MVMPIYDDQDTNLCLVYLGYKMEHPRATAEEIYTYMGFSRSWYFVLLKKWRDDGTMEDCRAKFMASRSSGIQGALDYVIDKWPAILEGQVNDALNPLLSAGERRKAAEFLKESVVDGYLANMPKGVSEERQFLESTTDESFRPTDIPIIHPPDPVSAAVPRSAEETVEDVFWAFDSGNVTVFPIIPVRANNGVSSA